MITSVNSVNFSQMLAENIKVQKTQKTVYNNSIIESTKTNTLNSQVALNQVLSHNVVQSMNFNEFIKLKNSIKVKEI